MMVWPNGEVTTLGEVEEAFTDGLITEEEYHQMLDQEGIQGCWSPISL